MMSICRVFSCVVGRGTEAQSLSWAWCQMSDKTLVSSSQNKAKDNSSMGSEQSNHQSTQYMSAPLFHSSLTMSSHVLWAHDRKVLRGHSGHWVLIRSKTQGCKYIHHCFIKSNRMHFSLWHDKCSAFVSKIPEWVNLFRLSTKAFNGTVSP